LARGFFAGRISRTQRYSAFKAWTRARLRKTPCTAARLNGFISTENISAEEAVKRAKEWPALWVWITSRNDAQERVPLDEKDEQSAVSSWQSQRAGQRASTARAVPGGHSHCGLRLRMKYNILRRLRSTFQRAGRASNNAGCGPLKYKPAGIFSRTAGRSRALATVQAVRRAHQECVPIFAFAWATNSRQHSAGKIIQMKFCHRGANQPVKTWRVAEWK